MFLDSPFPWEVVAFLTLLGALVVVWSSWRARAVLPRRHLVALLVLRVLALTGVALLVLNPFWVREKPDPDGFRVIVLADVSGSMETTDAGGRSRIEVVHELLDAEAADSLLTQLMKNYVTDVVPFVDEPLSVGAPLAIAPGTSALGDALSRLLDATVGRQSPGAVILISDGISHRGETLVEAGRRYRAAGIPVSTLGIGSRTPQGDVGVAFLRAPRRAPSGEPLDLPVRLESTFTREMEVAVGLYAGDRQVGETSARLPAQGSAEVNFEVVPDVPGFETYRVRLLNPQPDDANPANDQAYATVEITPPDTLEVLYLSNRVGNTFRFLQGLARRDGALDLRAVVRMGEDRYFAQGLEARESSATGFPVLPEFYWNNRVLILDTRVLAELDRNTQDIIRGFLEDRAGGILFMGPPEAVPTELRPLLPVREAGLMLPLRREPLELTPDPVFREASGGVLFMPPGLFLAANLPAGVAGNLSRGARVAASTRQGDFPVLAVQAYGAGRTAWLGLEDTWRWRMESARSAEQFPLFWTSLLGWLGAGGKPRLETPVQSTRQVTGQPVALDVRVLGRDFRPAAEARVEAMLSGPEGGRPSSVTLVPGPYEVGHYTGSAVLTEPGEYRVDYRVVLPDGEELSRRVFLVGVRQGREYEDTVFREEPLRDLARITGGRYAHYTRPDALLPLSLASGLPILEERIHWTRTGLFLILLLTVASLEWLLRRRLGLR